MGRRVPRKVRLRTASSSSVPPCVGCLGQAGVASLRPQLTMETLVGAVAGLSEAVIDDELVVLDRRNAKWWCSTRAPR